jgi:hypothetical protein
MERPTGQRQAAGRNGVGGGWSDRPKEQAAWLDGGILSHDPLLLEQEDSA